MRLQAHYRERAAIVFWTLALGVAVGGTAHAQSNCLECPPISTPPIKTEPPPSSNGAPPPPTELPGQPNYGGGGGYTAPTRPRNIYPAVGPLQSFNDSGGPDDREMQSVTYDLNNISSEAVRPLAQTAPEANGTDPVHDGELVLHETDIHLPGRGIPFNFVRTYRSRVRHIGVLGYGWDFNYNRRIVGASSCGDVEVLMGDSSRVRFPLKSEDSAYVVYSTPPGVPLSLIKIKNVQPVFNIWVMRDGDGLTYQFDVNGLLTEIRDQAGNKITFGWEDVTGSLTSIGAPYHFLDGADVFWRIKSIRDTTGHIFYLTYQDPWFPNGSLPSDPQYRNPFLQCISTKRGDCSNPIVKYDIGKGRVDVGIGGPQDRGPYAALLSATDSRGIGHSYSYWLPNLDFQGGYVWKTTKWLSDSQADQFCSSACGAANDCHNLSVCDRPDPQCVDFFDKMQTLASPPLDRWRVCTDSILSVHCHTWSGAKDPTQYEAPYCMNPGPNHNCATQYCLNGNLSDWDTQPRNDGPFCNELCNAEAQCSQDSASDCLAIARSRTPFCGNSSYSDCRARYQAKDASGTPFHAFGRPEDIIFNLLEVRDVPLGRLIQSNVYGMDASQPSFDKIINQTQGDQLLDSRAPRSVKLYYFDLRSGIPTVPGIIKLIKQLPEAFTMLAGELFETVAGSPNGESISPLTTKPLATLVQPIATGITTALSSPQRVGDIPIFDPFDPTRYVKSLSDFNSVNICPAHCVRKVPPIIRFPNIPGLFQPPVVLPPIPIASSEWFILRLGPNGSASLRMAPIRTATTFGQGTWEFRGPAGRTVAITMNPSGTVQIAGSERAIADFFGASQHAVLQWGADLLPTARALNRREKGPPWKVVSLPEGMTVDPGAVETTSTLGVLLTRTDTNLATATFMTPVSETVGIVTGAGELSLVPNPSAPSVLQIRGDLSLLTDSVINGDVTVQVMKNGQLWIAPSILKLVARSWIDALLPILINFLGDAIPLGPADVCAEWHYAPAIDTPDITAAQVPATAVVVRDLYGVVRTEYYNLAGQLLREVNHHVIDNTGVEVTDYNYDDVSGALRGTRYPGGRRTCVESDPFADALQVSRIPAPNAPGGAVPDVRLYTYDRHKLMDMVVDPDSTNPATVHLERDGVGRVAFQTAKVDATHSTKIQFTYDAPPAVGPRTITAPNGTVTQLDDYTPTGPATVTAGVGDPDPIVTKTLFDAFGRPQQVGRLNHTGQVQTIGDINGIVQSSAFMAPDGSWQASTYEYKDTRLPTRIVGPKTTEYFGHDSLGHLKWTAQTGGSDVAPRASCMNYGVDGRLLSLFSPEGNLINYTYDDAARVVQVNEGYPETQPAWVANCVSELLRNSLPVPATPTHAPDVQLTRRVTYDAAGFPATATDGGGVSLTFVTDGFGRAIDTIDGQGNHHRRGFDSRGRIAWEAVSGPNAPAYQRPQSLDGSPGLQSMVEYLYDDLDRQIEIDRWHFANGQYIDPSKPKIITTITYDDTHGTQSFSVDGHPPTMTDYDAVGRVQNETLPNGLTISRAYSETATGDKVVYSYRGADGGLRTRTVYYDNSWRILKVKDAAPDDGIGILLQNDYDAFGRLHLRSVGPQVTQYDYDSYDRLHTAQELSGRYSRRLVYGWDGNDRLITVKDGNDGITHYGYDGLDRADTSIDPANGTTTKIFISGTTRVFQSVDPYGTTRTLSYDAAGRLWTDHIAVPGNVLYGKGIDRVFTYTPAGQLESATLNGNTQNPTNGSSVKFAYDSLGHRISEDSSLSPVALQHSWGRIGGIVHTRISDRGSASFVDIDRTYDDLGRLATVTAGGSLIARYGYEADAARVRFGANGTTISQPTLDPRGRFVGLDVSVGGAAVVTLRDANGIDGVPRLRQRQFGNGPLFTDAFQLDGAGRVVGENVQMTGVAAFTVPAADLTDAAVSAYFVDPGRGTTYRTYAFDAVGNILSRTTAEGSAAATFEPAPASSLNRYLTFGRNPGTTTDWEWAYDDRGGVAQIAGDSYSFDVRGLLATATSGNAQLSYAYDALGRRVFETEANGASRTIVWDGDAVAAYGDGSSTAALTVRVGNNPLEHIALLHRFGVGETDYLHQGPDGSVVAATNGGGLVEGYLYSAFGETSVVAGNGTVGRDSAIGNRLLFQGQLYDPELRAYYLRAREYRPDVARFLSSDPIGIWGGENGYAFAGSKPLSFGDPSGMTPIDLRPTYTTSGGGSSIGWQRLEKIHVGPGVIYQGFEYSRYRMWNTTGFSNFGWALATDLLSIPAFVEELGRGMSNTPYQLFSGANHVIESVDGWRSSASWEDKVERAAQGVAGACEMISAAVCLGEGSGAVMDGLSTRFINKVASFPADEAGTIGIGFKNPINLRTDGLSAAEAQTMREYAKRSNEWLSKNGPQVITPTAGELRAAASAAARSERLRAAAEGTPYQYQVGHVPDTAVTGQPNPPAGWIDVPGCVNQSCGGVLGSRVGQVVDGFLIDGKKP